MVLYKPLRLHQGQGLGSLHRGSNSPGHIRRHLPRCSTPRSWQENCYDRSSLLDRPRCRVAWADGDSNCLGIPSRQSSPTLEQSQPARDRLLVVLRIIDCSDSSCVWFRLCLRPMAEGEDRCITGRAKTLAIPKTSTLHFLKERGVRFDWWPATPTSIPRRIDIPGSTQWIEELCPIRDRTRPSCFCRNVSYIPGFCPIEARLGLPCPHQPILKHPVPRSICLPLGLLAS